MRAAHKRIDWTGTLSRKSGAAPEAASALDAHAHTRGPLCLSHSSQHLNCRWHRRPSLPPLTPTQTPIFLHRGHLQALPRSSLSFSEPQPSRSLHSALTRRAGEERRSFTVDEIRPSVLLGQSETGAPVPPAPSPSLESREFPTDGRDAAAAAETGVEQCAMTNEWSFIKMLRRVAKVG